MSISPELVLAIWGSVTGTISVIVLILKYLKEKPRIEAELIDAKHGYQDLQSDEKDYVLMFLIRTRVKNRGDRATTIGEAILEFTIENHDHKITQTDGSRARVDPNDMVTVQPTLEHYSSYDKEPKQEEIQFKLTLIHTHGEEKLEGTSNARARTGVKAYLSSGIRFNDSSAVITNLVSMVSNALSA